MNNDTPQRICTMGQIAYETFADGGKFFASPGVTWAAPKQEQAGSWERLPEYLRELWERTAQAVLTAQAAK